MFNSKNTDNLRNIASFKLFNSKNIHSLGNLTSFKLFNSKYIHSPRNCTSFKLVNSQEHSIQSCNFNSNSNISNNISLFNSNSIKFSCSFMKCSKQPHFSEHIHMKTCPFFIAVQFYSIL